MVNFFFIFSAFICPNYALIWDQRTIECSVGRLDAGKGKSDCAESGQMFFALILRNF